MFAFLIFFYCVRLTFENFQKNACKHLGDYPTMSVNPDCYFNPDVEYTTPEIIQNHGYHQVESHLVTTPDGYILQLFRIPPKSENGKKKPPIFLEHGILSDSSCFVFVGNRSLGLSLAADGYDVWLGNYRGSIYSRGHASFKTSDEEYWNFTLDTVVANDIPASLRKVSTVTGKAAIYIGHSRGALLGLMYLVDNPKPRFLRGMVALAPVAYLDPELYIKLGSRLGRSLQEFFQSFGQWAIAQDPEIMQGFQFLCPAYPRTCQSTITLFSGESRQFLADDLFNMVKHFPSAFSLKEYLHFTQLVNTGRLQKFDYGEIKNFDVYGQADPPIYDLRKITAPVYMFYARNDVFVSEKSVIEQFNDLGSRKKDIFKIPIGSDDQESQWAHLDFLYGKDIPGSLYKPLKRVLEEKLFS